MKFLGSQIYKLHKIIWNYKEQIKFYLFGALTLIIGGFIAYYQIHIQSKTYELETSKNLPDFRFDISWNDDNFEIKKIDIFHVDGKANINNIYSRSIFSVYIGRLKENDVYCFGEGGGLIFVPKFDIDKKSISTGSSFTTDKETFREYIFERSRDLKLYDFSYDMIVEKIYFLKINYNDVFNK